MRIRCFARVLLTGFLFSGPGQALAAQELGARELGAQEELLRGGTFELGGLVGLGSFQGKSELESCTWWGVRVGHRFEPFSGIERLQFGFRAGVEGCLTEHSEIGRVDMIYANASFLLGFRLSGSWLLYWDTGLGELLADSTPGPGDEVDPRFSVHFGPGVTWALARHLLLDASLIGIVFEDFELGDSPVGGSTLGLMPTLMLAIQI